MSQAARCFSGVMALASDNCSIAAGVIGLVVMQAGRAGRDRQPGSHPGTGGQSPVPALFRGKYDVAIFGGDQRLALDEEFLLAFHDQPEFGEILMEVAEIVDRRGGGALGAEYGGPGSVGLVRGAPLS